MAAIDDLNSQRFYHGTKADLRRGDLIKPGYNSNYGKRKKAAYVCLTATLDAAMLGDVIRIVIAEYRALDLESIPFWPTKSAGPEEIDGGAAALMTGQLAS